MRKLITALLAIALFTGMFGSALAATDPNTLVVGTPAMNGDFIEGFGNSAYDASIKTILHRYVSTVAVDKSDDLLVNPTVVKDYTAETDEAGNKTYTWILHEDLKWSDGSAITANDFVFFLLYSASSAWVEAGAASGEYGYGLVGYEAYNTGDTDTFAGLKLLSEYSFSMTIDAKQLPYFYEISYANSYCAPMAVYAPNCAIVSDDNGSKLVGKDVDQAAENAADENYKALLGDLQNVAQTERFAPSVVSGPYKFVQYENQTVTLELNEYFKGNYEGKKPTIQYIEQRFVNQETEMDMLIAGDIDLISGVIEGEKIEKAKADPNTKTHSYLRNGYGMLAMHCDWGVTADVNVRWSLAYLIDRNAVLDYVLGGYGGIVQAEYGYAQWMYEDAGADLEEMLTPFNLNLDKANEHLDLTEWKYEADGTTPFDASKADAEGTYLRHNDKGEALVVHHLGTTDNTVTDIIEIQYTANAPLAGVKFEVTKGDFNALLDNYYEGYAMGGERYYNTFNLGNTFGSPFDPYFSSWHSDYCGSWENSNQLSDAELDGYIMEMRSLESDQKDEFVEIWLKYEKRWQDLMPSIPLYSNEYFDCYNAAVDGMNTTPFATWDQIVCEITKNAE